MNNNSPADDKTRVAGMPDVVATPGHPPQEPDQPVPPVKPAWPPQEPPSMGESAPRPAWMPAEPSAPPPQPSQPPAWVPQEPPMQPAPPANPPTWQAPEPVPPPPTPQPPSWASQPVQPTAPPPPSWQPQEPSQPAPVSSRPFSPAAPAQDLYRLSSQQDDMWFVVEPPSKPVRHPLRQGEAVTVGREATQNIVINEKTLSRNHLVLRRSGDRVAVQILGLNGLVYANQVHKSTTLEIPAPASLTIGNVICKIEKKYDTDATILMNDPAAALRHQPAGNAHPATPTPSWTPQQQPYAPLPPEGRHPLADNHSPAPGYPTGQPAAGYTPPPGSPSSYSFGQAGHPGDRDPGGFAPHRADAPGGSNKNRLPMLIGGIGLVALLIVGGLYYWFNNKPAAPVEPPPATTTVQPPAPTTTSTGGCTGANQGANNLYAKYLSKAATLLKEGNAKDACDYLKDIPQNSACWPEALSLAKQIEGCTLE